MRSITIRKIPDETYRILKRRAVDRDLPLGIYMLQIVEAHVQQRQHVDTDSRDSTLPSTDAPVTDTPEQERKG